MKKNTILHKIGQLIVPLKRTMSPLEADSHSACGGHFFNRSLLLMLLMMILGVGSVWGDDYSGIYYIANGKQLEGSNKYYDKNDPSVNYYLCPAQYYYNPGGSGTDVVSTTNNTGFPFLTTYKTNQGDNSIWIIEKVENKDTYYIKYIGTGDEHDKYVIKNESLKSYFSSGVDDTRLRVHLEEKAKSELNTDAEFEIIKYVSDDNIYYGIRISTITNGWLNPSKGNKQDYKPNGTEYIGGIIGYYKDKSPNATGGEGSKWYLEKVPPTISYNSSNLIKISYLDASYTIYYSYGEESTPSPSSEGTYSYSETGPFDPPAGTTTIKAIAIKDGKESGVATFTPAFFLGENHKYLIQSQGNGWTTGAFQGNHFYMIPGDIDTGSGKTKVNTTSMFRPSMQWYILHAGTTDDVTYYYIVHNDNRRIRYDSTNGIHLDTWDNSNADEFKFQIVESPTAGTYNIIPYGVTGYYLNKAGGNGDYRPLALHNNANDANSRWKFVKKNALVETAPFTVTENNSITYYKLQTATTYYVTPPSLTGGAVTVSNSTDADVVNSRNWYFEVAQVSSDADWLTWYYIRNAVTGDYLYYSGPNSSNDVAAFITKGSLNETDVNDMKRYRFTWVRSATVDGYFIVPQLLKDETQNYISGLNRYSTNLLRIQKKRSGNESLWQFVTADYTIAPPNIVYNADVNTVSLSCTTPGATIYYTTDNNEATTTSGNSGTSIDLKAEGKEGVTIIRAIAEVSGTSSNEATNNIIVQATVGNTKRSYLIRNNQSPWTVGDNTMFVYYMIPSDVVSGNTTVNTTSMPRPTMEWYFEHAGKADGKQYYYIVNASTGDYFYRTGSAIYMKPPSEKTTLEAASDNGFKFYLIPRAANGSNHVGYSIVPYGETTTNFVSKASGNNDAAAVKLEGTDNDYKRWNFVTKTDLMNDLATKLPFTPSNGSSSTYYKIENGNTDGGNYYVIPPASESGNATASISEEAAVVKSGSWYFVQVQAPTNVDWLTYYKIINAETGKALYYAYTNNSSNCLKVGDYVENDGNYMFAFVKSPTTDYYYIVPKAVKDNQLANISTFWRDGSNIKPATTRASGGNAWTFILSDDLFCNNPEFVEEEGVIKIKCNTNGARIYINTESDANPTNESTLYDPTNPNNAASQNWAITDKVRIKAIAVVSDGTNTASSSVFTLLNNPDITLGGTAPYIYNASPWEPGVTEVSIGEASNKTSTTSGYSITYSENHTDAGDVTVNVTDNVEDDLFIKNASTTFTIQRKGVTITANDASKTYNGSALTQTEFSATALETGDDHTFTVTMTEESTITNVGTQPNVIATVDGTTVSTEAATPVGNYSVTIENGTLTINPKAVTITASDASKTYDGAALTENDFEATALEKGDDHTFTVVMTEGSTITNVGTQPNVIATVDGVAVSIEAATLVDNYSVTIENGALTINPKAVTITASDASKTYDGAALTAGFTTTALEEGDTHGFTVDMTEGSTITNVGTTGNVIATVDGTAVTTGIETAVGNYLVTTANGTLEVTAKAVTITAKDASRAYNGSALTENSFEKTALEEGDEHEFVVVMTEASTITNVGTTGNVIATVDGIAVITGTETTVGNYLVTTADGTLTVNAKAVTITANDASKPYDGSALTEASFTASALETGDTHTFTVVMTDESTITNAGTQPNVIATVDGVSVTTGAETAVGNYLVTTVNGTLTVTGKLITITADSDTKVYDGTALTKDSYTCDNAELDEGDVITSVTVTGSQTVVGSSDNVPSEAVIMNGETDVTGKYFITYVNGTLEVTPKVVTITASDASKTYDGAALTAGFTTTALETGDTHEFIVVMTEGSTITNVGTTGNVIATVDGIAVTTGIEAAVGNYLVTTANGTLTVEQKAVTITANDASKPYDGSALTEGGFTTSALEEGDTHVFTVVMTEGSTITDAGTQPNVIATVDGVSVTTGVQTEVGNYLVTTVAGTLAIGGKPIGDGSLAAGFTISFDQDNNVILMDGGTTLDEGTDYTIDDDATTSASGRYSIRTIRGTGNYGGTASIRNAIVSFTNDGKGGSEYSATFVAENANPDAEPDPEKGHELPDGITAYIISAINGNTVNAVALSYIPEGVPVLLLSNAALNGFQVHDVSDQTPPTGNNLLKEVTEESRHFDVKTIYLLYKNEFAYNKAGDLAKGKVYLDPASSSPSGARLVINWGAENGVDTSLLSPLASPLSEVWHSLDGRRLSGKPTKKGLYIRDGEIVVIK